MNFSSITWPIHGLSSGVPSNWHAWFCYFRESPFIVFSKCTVSFIKMNGFCKIMFICCKIKVILQDFPISLLRKIHTLGRISFFLPKLVGIIVTCLKTMFICCKIKCRYGSREPYSPVEKEAVFPYRPAFRKTFNQTTKNEFWKNHFAWQQRSVDDNWRGLNWLSRAKNALEWACQTWHQRGCLLMASRWVDEGLSKWIDDKHISIFVETRTMRTTRQCMIRTLLIVRVKHAP